MRDVLVEVGVEVGIGVGCWDWLGGDGVGVGWFGGARLAVGWVGGCVLGLVRRYWDGRRA